MGRLIPTPEEGGVFMTERFRNPDRGREQERPADTEEPETTVRDREEDPAATTIRDRSDEPATGATAVREREEAPATTVAAGAGEPATQVAPPRERLTPGDRFDRELRRRRTLAPVVADETLAAMRERQRIRFGGFSWG